MQESRDGPSLGSASEPSGLDKSLKNTPPVTASPIVPKVVSVKLVPYENLYYLYSAKIFKTFAGFTGSSINCHPGHLMLGLDVY